MQIHHPHWILWWLLGAVVLVVIKLVVRMALARRPEQCPVESKSKENSIHPTPYDLDSVRSPLDRGNAARGGEPLEAVERFTMISRIT